MLEEGRAHGLQRGPHEVEIRTNVRLRMRDGVHLATDLYLPRTSSGETAKRPCLLERTPYDKTATAASDVTLAHAQPISKPELAIWFASHGYAMAMQDCRGRYSSEGHFTKYINEGEDGVDTIAWLAEQPWCDGRVLTQGLSYCAHVQTALGSFAPPALFAQFVDSGGFSNAYQGGIRQGGAFELKQATWALKHALLSPAIQADPMRLNALQAQDMRAWFGRMPWKRGDSPVSAAPEYEEYLFDQWERGEFSDYWKQRALCGERHYDEYADVPMVHMSSWYDPYVRTAIDNYLGLSRQKTGPVHLIMGPWTHGKRSLSYAGDVDFGPDATLDQAFGMSYLELRRKWYDHLLDPQNENPLARGAVSIFLMGGGGGGCDDHGRLQHGGRWVHADRWPLSGTQNRDFYLHAEGTLLADASSLPVASRSFAYDPSHPVPTLGGTVTSADSVMLPGAYDQREHARFFGADGSGRDLGERADVVSFRTAPLHEAVEVVGEISARLFLSSDCPDTDITIKLIDEYPPSAAYPDGFAMNLTDGILRVRYRDSWEHTASLEPGKVVEITVEAFATANLFARGHRIRLDISSSNYPHFDLNPNTGGPQVGWSEHRIAHNTLHLDREHPSRLLLPIRASTTQNQTAQQD